MARNLFFTFFILIALCLSANPNIKKLIAASGSASDYPGANVLVIIDSTNVDAQESGLSYVNRHQLFKVLTQNGANRLSTIIYDYDPLSAFIEIQKVFIHKKDGETLSIGQDKIKDYPAPARMIYWGARQKIIDIGRLEPGDAVEVIMFRKGFTYALLQDEDDKYIPPMKGHYYDIVEFWGDDPIREKVYKTSIPNTKNVVYKFYNGDVDSVITKGDLKTTYSFTYRNYKPIEKEPSMVALSDIGPKLLISTSPEWEMKSTWFYNVNEDFGSFESTPEIDRKVKEILKKAESEEDSISLLTHWVADEIRYSGISMGDGEGFTLHKSEMTFNDRCGVCKDKAGMLITMLRSAGFESYPAMTMAGSRIDNIPADQFNHCVTVVKKADGKYHLLDPTWVPFVRELWSSAEQQQNYLMGVPEGADLMETDISPAENHYFKIEGNSTIDEAGNLKGKLTITAEGQSDASLRRTFVRSYRTEWNRLVEEELLATHPLFVLDSLEYGNPYDYSSPIRLEISYHIDNYATVTSSEIIFRPFSCLNLFENYNRHLAFNTTIKERKYPFRDRCSRMVDISENITLPAFTDTVFIPATELHENTAVSYSGGYSFSNNTITIKQNASFNKRVYAAEDWPSFSAAVAAQNKFSKEYLILKR